MAEASDEQLREALLSYPAALVSRAAASKSSHDLVRLDAWMRTDLRALLAERRDTGTLYITRSELGTVMELKLAVRPLISPTSNPRLMKPQRGKWRPRLHAFALSNAEELVKSTTTAAFNPKTTAAAAMKGLCVLKGVGPATASLLLSLASPEDHPFLSDEAYEAMGLGKCDYTVKSFEVFRAKMGERVKSGWKGMEELEMACWSYMVLQRSTPVVKKAGVVRKRKAEVEEGEETVLPAAQRGRSSRTAVVAGKYAE